MANPIPSFATFDDAAAEVRRIIGDRATSNARHAMCAIALTRMLQNENLSAEQIRQVYKEDTNRITDVIRNTFHVPLACHKDGTYSVRPVEAARFFDPDERPKQARRVRALIQRTKERKQARGATSLARTKGKDDLPEWIKTIAAGQLPSVRIGSSDFNDGSAE